MPPDKNKLKQGNFKGRFFKGMVLWNKGLKYSPDNMDTRWSKGMKPQYSMPLGTITLRKYKNYLYEWIKTEKGWVRLAKYYWEQLYGPIPEGYMIRHINGNTLDCTIENLELVTRCENMKKNSNPEKIKQIIRELYKRERIRKSIGLEPLTGLARRLK